MLMTLMLASLCMATVPPNPNHATTVLNPKWELQELFFFFFLGGGGYYNKFSYYASLHTGFFPPFQVSPVLNMQAGPIERMP